jgi:hypothetical protein
MFALTDTQDDGAALRSEPQQSYLGIGMSIQPPGSLIYVRLLE